LASSVWGKFFHPRVDEYFQRWEGGAVWGKTFLSAAQADAEMLHLPKLAQKNPALPIQQLTYGPL
jgi:hypothetical protein